MSAYCTFAPTDPLHARYHDEEYGFPIQDDNLLFERLIFEINQAGLSWSTILKKQDTFRAAYSNFDIDTVAAYGDEDRARLLADPGIIRNRLKVNAAIENAKRIQSLREEHGSFAQWIDANHPKSKEDWVRLFRKTFLFTGGEIVGEFLMSCGYLPGAHSAVCPVYARIAELKPAWMVAISQLRSN